MHGLPLAHYGPLSPASGDVGVLCLVIEGDQCWPRQLPPEPPELPLSKSHARHTELSAAGTSPPHITKLFDTIH